MLKWVVLSKRNAQLGNRLTMHAHLMACCLEKGCNFLNPTLSEYGDFFVGTRGSLANMEIFLLAPGEGC
jgi:hypothetical protein